MFNEKELKKAISHLSKDKKLKKIIENIDPPYWHDKPATLLESIVESIISQQLSVKAADTIYNRFLYLFGGTFPTATEIISVDDELIRSTGISRPKAEYIKGLAEMVHSKKIILDELHTYPDEKVIEELITIKGIGQWTAEMLLIFELRRPDIFSYGDLGLRNAISKIYNINRDDLISMEKIVTKWSPYRTLASRYLWKSLDNTPK